MSLELENNYPEIFAKMLNHWYNCEDSEEDCSICYDTLEMISILDSHENW